MYFIALFWQVVSASSIFYLLFKFMLSTLLFFKSLDSNSKIQFLIGFLLVFIFQIWNTYKEIAKAYDPLQYLKTA